MNTITHTLFAIGLGPGAHDLLTPRAVNAINECEVIAGYHTYLKQFPELFAAKEIIASGMRGELERCTLAMQTALTGRRVGVISSGDSGIYGMAGLLFELQRQPQFASIRVEVIPGVSAANAAAGILGAPLMNDFAVISLSDLLTPRDTILSRLRAAASASFVCVLYNPASHKRRELIREAVAIFSAAYGSDTPAGIVHDASRPAQQHQICTLGDFPFDSIDMTTIVIIGNPETIVRDGRMFTARGYEGKYVQS